MGSSDAGSRDRSHSLSRSSTAHELAPVDSKPESNWVEVDDNDDPQRWPQSRKLKVMVATVGFCILVSGASSSFAVGLNSMVDDLGTSQELGSLALAIFVIGECLSIIDAHSNIHRLRYCPHVFRWRFGRTG